MATLRNTQLLTRNAAASGPTISKIPGIVKTRQGDLPQLEPRSDRKAAEMLSSFFALCMGFSEKRFGIMQTIMVTLDQIDPKSKA